MRTGPGQALYETARGILERAKADEARTSPDKPFFIFLGESHYCTYDSALMLALLDLIKSEGLRAHLGLEHEHDAPSYYFSQLSHRTVNLPKAARRFPELGPEGTIRALVGFSVLQSEKLLAYWAHRNNVPLHLLDLMTRHSTTTENDEALDLADEFTHRIVKSQGRTAFQNMICPISEAGNNRRNWGMKERAVMSLGDVPPEYYLVLTGSDHLSKSERFADEEALDARVRAAGFSALSVRISNSGGEAPEGGLSIRRGAGPDDTDYFRHVGEEALAEYNKAERQMLTEYFAGSSLDIPELLRDMEEDSGRWRRALERHFRARLEAFLPPHRDGPL